jgi:DNA-binding HxlR family transcriptional regulator
VSAPADIERKMPPGRYTDPRGIECGIVVQLICCDSDKGLRFTEIEEELHDVEPLALSAALKRLKLGGVVVFDGERLTASRSVKHLAALGMIAV